MIPRLNKYKVFGTYWTMSPKGKWYKETNVDRCIEEFRNEIAALESKYTELQVKYKRKTDYITNLCLVITKLEADVQMFHDRYHKRAVVFLSVIIALTATTIILVTYD